MSDETGSSKLKFLTPQQVLMLVTLVSGLILSQFQPLQSRRESESAGGTTRAADFELPASLLEDPLEVLKQIPGPQEKSFEAWLSGVINPKPPAPSPEPPLPKQLKTRLEDGKSIQIICSLMRPEMDSMSKELRLRERLAVVSALAAAGYGPDNTRKLSFHRFESLSAPADDGKPSAKKQDAKAWGGGPTAAYEWFSRYESLPSVEPCRFDGICVVWFNASELWGGDKKATIATLRVLLATIIGQSFEETKGTIQTAILGPHESTALTRLLCEAVIQNQQSGSQGEKAHEGSQKPSSWRGPLKMASPYATASAWGIVRAADLPELPGLPELPRQFWQYLLPPAKRSENYSQSERVSSEYQSFLTAQMNELLRGDAANASADLFLRTPLTDDYVSEALVDELKRRGVNLERGATAEEGDILLISEFDTGYGRELPLSFLKAVLQNDNPGQLKEQDSRSRWHWTPYARGLDGRHGRTTAPVAAAPQKESTEMRKKPAGDEPRGIVQTDALRRLAERIESLDRERKRDGLPGFVAVGILGADIYDKLLILRALRPLLKDAIFFTNNLDAWLWEAEELRSTRNLVIASPFGLRLGDYWQAGMPPFRDTYQTSVYAAALTLITDAKDLQGELNAGTEEARKQRVRLFEIGRSLPVEMSLREGNGAKLHPLHPPTERRVEVWQKPGQWDRTVALAGLLLGSYVLWRIIGRKPEAAKPWGGTPGWWIGKLSAGPGLIVVVLPATLGLAYYCSTKSSDGEVFLLWSGVSSWPFFALNLTAALVSVPLILKVLDIAGRGRESLQREFDVKESKAVKAGGPKSEARRRGRFQRLFAGFRRLRDSDNLIDHLTNNAAPENAALEHKECPKGKKGPKGKEGGTTGSGHGREKALNVDRLLASFHKSSGPGVRMVSAMCIALLSMVVIWLVSRIYPCRLEPVRGEGTRELIEAVEWASLVMVTLLAALVLDSLWLNRIFIDGFAAGTSAWSGDVLQRYTGDNPAKKGAKDYVDLRLIADWTKDMGKLTTLPFYVAALLVVARFDCFDAWHWPVHLWVALGGLAVVLIAVAYNVHSSAERLREEALKKLAGSGDEKLIKQITALSEGAFMPFSRQPVMAAVYWLVGAVGVTGVWQGISQLML